MGEREVAGSWVKRTNFSQTFHRSFSSSSLPFTPSLSIQQDGAFDSKKILKSPSTREVSPSTNNGSTANMSKTQAQTEASGTFREGKPQPKLSRSLTPHPRRKETDKGIMWKLLHRDSRAAHKPALPKWSPFRGPFKHSASVKLIDHKGREDSSWTTYFHHGGGKVSAVEAVDEHMVDLSALFLGLSFAHGAHSKLYHGVYKDEAVAVKIITMPENHENKILEARLKRQFNGEVALLCRLKHPNVITFIAAYSKAPVYCIVTEYLSEGSLRSYLHKSEHKKLPIKNTVAHALEIARGMEYIHSQGVIHRDLKPDNILIDEEFHMKIADFGIACDEEDCDPFDDDPGTYRWMAPEMIKHKCYGRKVDVYSFGLILWEMVSGSIPYEDMNPLQAAYAVVNKKLRPPFPDDCPHAMLSLIEQCWLTQPEKRPEFWQIVQVLEQFKSSLATDGTLEQVHNVTFQDHKKGLAHWIRKLTPPNSSSSSSMKPKFA